MIMAFSVSSRITGFLYSALSLLSIFGVIETILARGFLLSEAPVIQSVTHIAYGAVISVYLVWVLLRLIQSGWRFRPLVPDLFLSAALVTVIFPVYVGGSVVSFRIVFSLLAAVFRTSGVATLFTAIQINPARLLLLSFGCGVLAGSIRRNVPANKKKKWL
jgi:hypothetical protein